MVQLVLWQGSALEKIASGEITTGRKFNVPTVFLADDVVVGRYGIAGFLIVDARPEERFISYADLDMLGVSYESPPSYVDPSDSDRASHYVGTSAGFKLVRYFVLPKEVRDVFELNKYIGEGLIDQCITDGTLPDGFDEEKGFPNNTFWQSFPRDLVDAILKAVNPEYGDVTSQIAVKLGFDDLLGVGTRHIPYVSFHPWQHQKQVLEVAQKSLITSIFNLDMMVATIDRKNELPQRQSLVNAANYNLLPPGSQA